MSVGTYMIIVKNVPGYVIALREQNYVSQFLLKFNSIEKDRTLMVIPK